ncbi:hypothetical protein PBY51_014719 [Eleginops maclovinus]|uniref:BRCT domain-containing protein n=1 Tax=Eleginops maclovinus TaxID=56733 RepID=A0AAN7X1Q6_ELEMC|nr:hypothetical protein PBY51_014719 [Eleginops maclovinus]
MFHTPILPFARKRSIPVDASVPRHDVVKFMDVRLYLVERKMGRSRRNFLTQLARSKGFIVDDILSDDVTHVVSEDSQASSLWKWLKECAPKNLPGVNVLDISWFTDSMKEGRPVAVETKHLIQEPLPTEGSPSPPVATVSQYACQRRTTLENHNQKFTVRNVCNVTLDSGLSHVAHLKLSLCFHMQKNLLICSALIGWLACFTHQHSDTTPRNTLTCKWAASAALAFLELQQLTSPRSLAAGPAWTRPEAQCATPRWPTDVTLLTSNDGSVPWPSGWQCSREG